MTNRYKRGPNGKITRKGRCAVRGDMIKFHLHYNPNKVSAYSAGKISSRFQFSHARHLNQPIRHFDISSAFTHEQYDPDHTFYIRQAPLSEGTYSFPDSTFSILQMHSNGSKPAGHINLSALHDHMTLENYVQSTADPFLYYKQVPSGIFIIIVTIDDFLVTSHCSHYRRHTRTSYTPQTKIYDQRSMPTCSAMHPREQNGM